MKTFSLGTRPARLDSDGTAKPLSSIVGHAPRDIMKLFLVMVYGHNSRSNSIKIECANSLEFAASVVRAESREQVIELLKSETTSDGRAAFPNVHPSKVETFELESSGSSEIIAFI